jgi:hypothetical protein
MRMEMYVLVEVYVDKDDLKEFEQICYSFEISKLKKKLQEIKEEDYYGLFDKYGIKTDEEEVVESNPGNGFVGYYITSVPQAK